MNNKILKIAIFAAIVAVVAVVVLKLLGQDNTTVYGGAIAGAVVGATTAALGKKRKQ